MHATGAASRVIDGHTGPRIDDLDEAADDIGGGVELAGLFPSGDGEEFDEVFVGSVEQVGELEVLVAEGDIFEILDEVRQNVVIARCVQRASGGTQKVNSSGFLSWASVSLDRRRIRPILRVVEEA